MWRSSARVDLLQTYRGKKDERVPHSEFPVFENQIVAEQFFEKNRDLNWDEDEDDTDNFFHLGMETGHNWASAVHSFQPPRFNRQTLQFWTGYAKTLLDRCKEIENNGLPDVFNHNRIEITAKEPEVRWMSSLIGQLLGRTPVDATPIRLYSSPTMQLCTDLQNLRPDQAGRKFEAVLEQTTSGIMKNGTAAGIWTSPYPLWLYTHQHTNLQVCRLDITTTADCIQHTVHVNLQTVLHNGKRVPVPHVILYPQCKFHVKAIQYISPYLLNAKVRIFQENRLNDPLKCIECDAFINTQNAP